MKPQDLEKLLRQVKDRKISIQEAMDELKSFSIKDLGFAKLDYHRELRRGYPEIIYAEGKSIQQIEVILQALMEHNGNIIITRTSREKYEAIKKLIPEATYYEQARIVSIMKKAPDMTHTYICVVTAGTSDIPVAEEASVTAELLGNPVNRIYDIGVAGIHRLTSNLEEIKNARVIIVIAGMEGALASIVAGLVDKPVVAVPTSIGYGANLKGLSALLAMLTSCSGGIAVVNIDNGFGAGYYASMINKL